MTTTRRTPCQAPRITLGSNTHFDLGDSLDLVARAQNEGLSFNGADVSHEDLTGITFSECALEDVTLDGTKLIGARFIESRLAQINAPTLKAARTTWKMTAVSSSRLGAVEAYDSDLDQLICEGSKIGWFNLRSSRLQDVLIRNCHIEELDLTDANLRRVAFEDTSVGTLVLQGARSHDLDLRGMDFASITGFEGLKGAWVAERQAIEMLDLFAEHFGISISPS